MHGRLFNQALWMIAIDWQREQGSAGRLYNDARQVMRNNGSID